MTNQSKIENITRDGIQGRRLKFCSDNKWIFIAEDIVFMINSSYASRPMEALPEESRLVRQAKSGTLRPSFNSTKKPDVDRVYRYVYFRVIDNESAESITPRVFIKAWQVLDRYHSYGSTFYHMAV